MRLRSFIVEVVRDEHYKAVLAFHESLLQSVVVVYMVTILRNPMTGGLEHD